MINDNTKEDLQIHCQTTLVEETHYEDTHERDIDYNVVVNLKRWPIVPNTIIANIYIDGDNKSPYFIAQDSDGIFFPAYDFLNKTKLTDDGLLLFDFKAHYLGLKIELEYEIERDNESQTIMFSKEEMEQILSPENNRKLKATWTRETMPNYKRLEKCLKFHLTHDNIAKKAYNIWQEKGCPEGKANEHWNEAIFKLECLSELDSIILSDLDDILKDKKAKEVSSEQEDKPESSENYFWHDDFDTWYNFSHWVIAKSPAECDEIIGKDTIRRYGYKFNWFCNGKAPGNARYLGLFKNSKFRKEWGLDL